MISGVLSAVHLEEWGIATQAAKQAERLLTAVMILGTLRSALGRADELSEAPFSNDPAPSTTYVRVPPDSRGRVGWRRPSDGCGP